MTPFKGLKYIPNKLSIGKQCLLTFGENKRDKYSYFQFLLKNDGFYEQDPRTFLLGLFHVLRTAYSS